MLTALSGVLSQSGKPVYVWERYAVTGVVNTTTQTYNTKDNLNFTAYGSTNYTVSEKIFTLTDPTSVPVRDVVISKKYYVVGKLPSTGNTYYLASPTMYHGYQFNQHTMIATLYKYTVVDGKGSYIDTVESEDPSTYPTNGIQDGYWYVQIA